MQDLKSHCCCLRVTAASTVCNMLLLYDILNSGSCKYEKGNIICIVIYHKKNWPKFNFVYEIIIEIFKEIIYSYLNF